MVILSTAAADAGLSTTALLTVTATLVGVVLGRWLSDAGQHRQWLRNARLDAYEALLQAYDEVEAAAHRHMVAVQAVVERREALDESDDDLRQALIGRWNDYVEKRQQWERLKARVELAGTVLVAGAVFGMDVVTGIVHHFDCLEPDADDGLAADAAERWWGGYGRRRSARREFVAAARVDLQAVAYGAQVRRAWQRIARRVRVWRRRDKIQQVRHLHEAALADVLERQRRASE